MLAEVEKKYTVRIEICIVDNKRLTRYFTIDADPKTAKQQLLEDVDFSIPTNGTVTINCSIL